MDSLDSLCIRKETYLAPSVETVSVLPCRVVMGSDMYGVMNGEDAGDEQTPGF